MARELTHESGTLRSYERISPIRLTRLMASRGFAVALKRSKDDKPYGRWIHHSGTISRDCVSAPFTLYYERTERETWFYLAPTPLKFADEVVDAIRAVVPQARVMGRTREREPGWMMKQLEKTARDVATWPEWMRRAAGLETERRA
ncbi:MAG: hypothetical protein Q8Q41_04705 [bacterium]|nr:hypothetical protein [bacterium]